MVYGSHLQLWFQLRASWEEKVTQFVDLLIREGIKAWTARPRQGLVLAKIMRLNFSALPPDFLCPAVFSFSPPLFRVSLYTSMTKCGSFIDRCQASPPLSKTPSMLMHPWDNLFHLTLHYTNYWQFFEIYCYVWFTIWNTHFFISKMMHMYDVEKRISWISELGSNLSFNNL